MRGLTRRRLPAISGLLLTMGTVGLASASSAQATDATWSGLDPTPNWSAAANWGGSAPAANAVLGTLSFPDLGPSCAYSASPIDTCYTATIDDLGGLSAQQLKIDNAQGYDLEPKSSDLPGTDTITLNPPSTPFVGLAAAPGSSSESVGGFPYITVPVKLGDSQTWTIDGNSAYGFTFMTVAHVINSGSYALDLELSNDGNLNTTELDTGALTLNGSGSLSASQDASGNDAILPSAGITLSDGTPSASGPALNVQSPGTTSGPIDASAGVDYGNQVTVGSGSVPEASLSVSGGVSCGSSTAAVCLGPGTAFGFSIDGNDTAPAVDASQLTVDGDVILDGARMGMSQGYVDSTTQDCVNLTPGNTYTVLTATGTISGRMSYWDGNGYGGVVDEGQTSQTPTPFGQNCTGGPAPEAYINYGSHSITETIAAAPTSTAAPTISGTAAVGQTLSLSTGTWSAYPAPTYTYEWMACKSGNCSAISGATGSTFAVASAQEGDTIEAQVTATNSLGNASATSSPTGTVPAPVTTSTTTTTATTTPAPTLPTSAQVSSALAGIGHPTGRKPIAALIKTGSYTASLGAPSAGSASVAWTTVVTTGRGKHKKHRRVTVATGSGTAGAAGRITLRIHLTTAGRALLKRTPHNLHITATERFQPTGGSWTTLVKHFTL